MSRTLSSFATTVVLREISAWPKTLVVSRLRPAGKGAEWIWHFTPTSSRVSSAYPRDNGSDVDLLGGGADPVGLRLMGSVTDLGAAAMKSQFGLCVLVRAMLALWMVSACVQVPAQNPSSEILNILVDQRLTLTPVRSFAGVATNVPVPEIERTGNHDLYVKSENLNC